MTGLTPSAQEVLARRYLCRGTDGGPCETAEGMLRRVAHHVASAETRFGGDARAWEGHFYEAMSCLSFLPNSPTLMNAGRAYGQLSACFVLPVPDDVAGIFDTVKLAAVIHQTGGGTGFSFSRLRPRGDRVSTSGGSASGPVSFMRVFNEATEAINQGGFRRGANMAVLRCDHPDVLEFIRCKTAEGVLTNFNISVGVTEGLFRLAEEGETLDLVNPHTGAAVGRIAAAELLREAASCAWGGGEPGLVFLDRLNRDNPTPSLGEIETTNPCGEQPLLPYESCNLGSVNLSRLTKGGAVDWERLGELVELGVRFLDDVVEVNRYPDPKIAAVTLGNRKIGLGVMGFADLLVRLGLPYDSEEALSLARELMEAVSERGRRATAQLARERGAFPNFVRSSLADGPPVRNATTTTVAPTGTISVIAGCSSGIEPLYALALSRRVLEGEELRDISASAAEAIARAGLSPADVLGEGGELAPSAPESLRRILTTARRIAPEWHVRMQAAFQEHVDNAVSKTVNLPESATVEDVLNVFKLAEGLGCKGITVYRDRSRAGQVLSGITPCPECGSALAHSEGCTHCPNPSCGYARCG